MAGLSAFAGTAAAQLFVSGLAGTTALSGGSVVRAVPPAAATYDPKLGSAANIAVGYHFNDWVSAQAGCIWNRNRVIVSQLAGTAFSQSENTRGQNAVAVEAMLYFRPRQSHLRPYLSVGPAMVIFPNENLAALRVAAGIDIGLGRGWAVRYNFSETISSNPFARDLNPAASGKLMNFQNLFGVVKTF